MDRPVGGWGERHVLVAVLGWRRHVPMDGEVVEGLRRRAVGEGGTQRAVDGHSMVD